MTQNLEDAGRDYLLGKAAEKAGKTQKGRGKSALVKDLAPGSSLSVDGSVYEWTLAIAPSAAYKKAIDSVLANFDDEHRVMLEEAIAATTGSKKTYDLKLATGPGLQPT